MSNVYKAQLLGEVTNRFGEIRKLAGSQSLFTLGADAARIYIRYSKSHQRGRTFFGLREVDLRQLEGRNSFICFVLDDGSPPVFVLYADFEEVFRGAQVAKDGQYKVELISHRDARELYVARQGRFNVEGYVGFETLERNLQASRLREARDLSHLQAQTLLAGIGHVKGYEVHIPENDAGRLDWSVTKRFPLRESIPSAFQEVRDIVSEIDVIWISRGRNNIEGLYEVEHSTPVYSGLFGSMTYCSQTRRYPDSPSFQTIVGERYSPANFLVPRSGGAGSRNSQASLSTATYSSGTRALRPEETASEGNCLERAGLHRGRGDEGSCRWCL